MTERYIRQLDPLAAAQRNWTNVLYGSSVASRDSASGGGSDSVTRPHTLGSMQQPPWQHAVSAPRSAEELVTAIIERDEGSEAGGGAAYHAEHEGAMLSAIYEREHVGTWQIRCHALRMEVGLNETIEVLKQLLHVQEKVPVNDMRLVLDGRELSDGATLAQSGMERDAILDLKVRGLGGMDEKEEFPSFAFVALAAERAAQERKRQLDCGMLLVERRRKSGPLARS